MDTPTTGDLQNALEGLQSIAEAIEAALAQVGYADIDEAGTDGEDVSAGTFTDEQYTDALETVQSLLEGAEGLLEGINLDDPDDADDAAEVDEGEPPPTAARSRVRRARGPMLFVEELRNHIGNMSLLRAPLQDVNVRTADDAAEGQEPDLLFTGHAIVFDVLSDELGGRGWSFKEKVARGAARKALDEDQDVVYLYDHEGLVLSRTAAKTMALSEVPRGLYVDARAAPTTPAKDLAIAMRAGNVRHMSFAFTVAEDSWEETYLEDGTVEAVRTVTKIDRLFDVSAVGHPAYPQTDAQVRGRREARLRDLDRVAKRYGLRPPELPETLDELALRVASTSSPDHEAREAALRELQDGAKRRLTLARARSNLS